VSVRTVRVIAIPSRGGFDTSTLSPGRDLRPMHLLFQY
jgi:hypothetical protein